MDDRRFDSLVKALAEGKSRRSLLKGILGLGGAALVGGTVLESDTDAARRPVATPTPTTKCPGNQAVVGGVCTCPASAPNKCGPACCTGKVTDGYPRSPGHTECCDNACCNGTCYGEEQCCPTNPRTGGQLPLAEFCSATNECCLAPEFCCSVDGCCSTFCYGGPRDDSFCCPDAQACPGGSESDDDCCNVGETCCGGGTNANYCADFSAGECCAASDCPPPGEGACGVQCVGGQCVGVICTEGFICCQDQCVSSSGHVACPADPDECCATATELCCGDGGCCPGAQCNEIIGVCCDPGQATCGTGENACCDAPLTCCGQSRTCCAPGNCTTAGECCSNGTINCVGTCCPEDMCLDGQGCCPEGSVACGSRCCNTNGNFCDENDECVCNPGTEPCSLLPGPCCPVGQCINDFVCCPVGTTPCGSICCPTGQCDAAGICACTNGLVRCDDECQECCDSQIPGIDNCQTLYGYDLNCVYCPQGVCDTTPFNGSQCETDDTQELGKCDDGFCIPCGGGASAPCEEDDDCCSGNCFNGNCTDP